MDQPIATKLLLLFYCNSLVRLKKMRPCCINILPCRILKSGPQRGQPPAMQSGRSAAAVADQGGWPYSAARRSARLRHCVGSGQRSDPVSVRAAGDWYGWCGAVCCRSAGTQKSSLTGCTTGVPPSLDRRRPSEATDDVTSRQGVRAGVVRVCAGDAARLSTAPRTPLSRPAPAPAQSHTAVWPSHSAGTETATTAADVWQQ